MILTRIVRSFCRDERGNVAIMLALCLVPIILAVGVAVDLSRGWLVKERLGQAIDSAALAAGSSLAMTETAQADYVRKYVEANYTVGDVGTLGTLTITEANDVITVTATATMDTAFMSIAGFDELTFNLSTEVMRNLTGLELVMVLDNTGSMSGSKLTNLKSAATTLVDTLFGDETTSDSLKIGLVPFAAAVNVGTSALGSGWLDETGASTMAQDKMDWSGSSQTVFDLYDEIPNRSWTGCVEARAQPYDTTDDDPSGGDTLFQPYFAPDEPDDPTSSNGNGNGNGNGNNGNGNGNGNGSSGTGFTYDNNYLSDGISGTTTETQMDVSTYDGSSLSISSRGPQKGCTTDPVTPMTNNKSTIQSAINSMNASGYTHIPVGVVWGWRLVSPGEPFTEGADYSDDEWTKAVVILTDGENTIDSEANDNGSNYGAYGHLSEGRMGTTDNYTFEDQLDTNTSALCTSIKAEGIRVYTITFDLNVASVRTMMRNCASESSLYFDSPSGAALEAAFEAIARDLNNLRLTK